MRRKGTIRTWYLSERDAERLYLQNPNLRKGYEDFCPTCNTKKVYHWKGEDHECDCELQLQLYKHYLSSGIGVNYQRLSWDDYQDQSVRDQLSAYYDQRELFANRGIGLLFTGSYGTGKTLASTLLLKDLVKSGYSCFSTTFASMVEMFTSGWRSSEDQRYFQEKFVHSEVLLLDDLGRELKTKNRLAETTFDDVLRRRVQDGRPTFLTTNMDYEELNDGYGGAILSLLKEVSITQEFSGDDFRPISSQRALDEIRAGEIRPIF